MTNFDDPFLPHLGFDFAQYVFYIIHIDALKFFTLNKEWYLCAILQKLVILKAAQNFRDKTFNGGDFPFQNQILLF
jgi:hypothetical protein